MNNKNLSEQLIKKSIQEPGFRKKLLGDPKSVIQEETGINLPDNIIVTVLEEKPDEFYLVLPPVESADGELSEAELDSVAGGWGAVKDNGIPNKPKVWEG